MPRISSGWKAYTESGKYFEDLQTKKISLDPVAKRKAVKTYKKKHKKLPSVRGNLKPITKTQVNKIALSPHKKNEIPSQKPNNSGSGGINLQDFKWIFPPLGLLPDQKGSNLQGDEVTDTGNLLQFVFPPAGFTAGGSGQQVIDAGKKAKETFDLGKLALIGGVIIGGFLLFRGIFK